MSIQRTQSQHATDAAQRRDATERLPGEQRPAPPPQQVKEFQGALQQARELAGQLGRGEAGQQVAEEAIAQEAAAGKEAVAEVIEESVLRRNEDLGLSSSSQPPGDAAAMFQAQLAMRDGAPVPTQVPPTATANDFFELVERHVRQLAVGGSGQADGDGQVLLRMSDSTLPGTDLLLTRGEGGWLLRADVRSRESFDAITEAAPELARRFAERNLGTLTIDPHYNG